MKIRFYSLFLISSFLCVSQAAYSMDQELLDLEQEIANLDLNEVDSYYSDSEDADGYAYPGLPPLTRVDEKEGKECVPLLRGIHFSPSKFSREEISQMRRKDEAGEDILSSAAYDLANVPLGSTENKIAVRRKATRIKKQIKKLSTRKRHKFQEVYSNQYTAFHNRLGTNDVDGIFKDFESKKNPQVSTAENFFHANKYASGLKFLGEDVESLDPEYDERGKPKHPYLGKLYAILVDTEKMAEQDPYFVVHGHGNDDISISNHYSKNVLEEREVSFPGLVPGDSVVLSTPIRVPSFEGDYKPWYQQKFGISKRTYNARKKILTTGKYFKDEKGNVEEIKQKTVKSLLEKVVLPHAAQQLKKHIAQECETKNINLVHKQLDGTFGPTLPSIPNANSRKKRIKERKNRGAA